MTYYDEFMSNIRRRNNPPIDPATGIPRLLEFLGNLRKPVAPFLPQMPAHKNYDGKPTVLRQLPETRKMEDIYEAVPTAGRSVKQLQQTGMEYDEPSGMWRKPKKPYPFIRSRKGG